MIGNNDEREDLDSGGPGAGMGAGTQGEAGSFKLREDRKNVDIEDWKKTVEKAADGTGQSGQKEEDE